MALETSDLDALAAAITKVKVDDGLEPHEFAMAVRGDDLAWLVAEARRAARLRDLLRPLAEMAIAADDPRAALEDHHAG